MSRELDALVAERVMGWRLIRKNGYESWWTYESIGRTKKALAHRWSPSSDIATAWEVVERLGLSVLCIQLPEVHGGARGWQVRRWVSTRDECASNHAEMPMAVCLCSLRAVGVDESTIEKARAAP